MGQGRSYSRLLGVAIMAIVGMLSTVDVASACSTSPAPQAAKPCCGSRPPGECACCPSDSVAAWPERSPIDAIATNVASTYVPSPRGCECRANAPAAPADRQGQRTSEQRSDVAEVCAIADVALRTATSRERLRFATQDTGPPRAPLYLLISHLLI